MKKKLYILFLFFAGVFGAISAQNSIDINVGGSRSLQSEESNNPLIKEIFKDVDRYRSFNYNKQLAYLRSNNVGDTLLLNFFDDKQYKAVIQNVSLTNQGRTAIVSTIVGAEFAYCYIIVSENTITISAEIPLEDAYFFASVKEEQAYIGQLRKSEIDKNVLEGSGPQLAPFEPNLNENHALPSTRGETDFVEIDLLYTYTPAAAAYATASLLTDIHDVITTSVLKANEVMTNSGTQIHFNVVYEHLTNYVETNSSLDLNRITSTSDGYMDEVHDLRNAFYADVIVFVPKVSYTGGVSWLLNDENGFSQDNHAVALSRVQQTSNTYTVVHEIGHNMGCGHHANQLVEPGPGLHGYASGWRGIIGSDKKCTVMTYEDGSYFADNQAHVRIPYFSSPDLTVGGTTIGSSTENNALTLKKTKTAVAAYRTRPSVATLTVLPTLLSFADAPTRMVAVSGFNLGGNISYALSGVGESAFMVTPTEWNAAVGGILTVSFIGSPTLDYEATLTINGTGATSKTVTLRYEMCSSSVSSFYEDCETPVFPPECWTSESATGTPWTRTTGQGINPSTYAHSGSGMLEFRSSGFAAGAKGLLISPKIVTNKNTILTFWMARDHFDDSYTDHLNVYLSETPSILGLTPLETYHVSTYIVSGLSGWSKYTLSLPTAAMNEAYIIFEGVKENMVNIYIDDIKLEEDPCPGNSALPITENFDNTEFPPICWTQSGTLWNQQTTGIQPACSPHSLPKMAEFRCSSLPTNGSGLLISPKFTPNNKNSILTFWINRFNVTTTNSDHINVYLNSTPSILALMPVKTYHVSTGLSPSGGSTGWNKYTLELPTAAMSEAYVIFEGVKEGFANIYIDDITIMEKPACDFSQDFEESVWTSGGTAYAKRTVTDSKGDWIVAAVTSGLTSGTDHFIGAGGVRLRGNATADTLSNLNRIEMNFDKSNGIGTVSFDYASYSTHQNGVIRLHYSTNQGANWTEVEGITVPSWSNGGSVMQKAYLLVNIPGQARIKITKDSQSGSTSVNIDNICISDYFSNEPTLTVEPSILPFGNVVIGATPSQEITVSGIYLTEDISYSKSGSDAAAFQINETSWGVDTGGILTVTFIPTQTRLHEAEIIFTSQSAAPQTVTLSGTGVQLYTLYFEAGNGDPVSPITESGYGAGVVLPATLPSLDCQTAGYTFAGWATAAVETETGTAPTLYAVGTTYLLAENDTLYAVYKNGEFVWKEVTALPEVTAGEYVITFINANDLSTYYYLPNQTASTSANPIATTGITVSGDILTNAVTNNMKWTFTGDNATGFAITRLQSNGITTHTLSATNAAQGIKVLAEASSTTWKALNSTNSTYGGLLLRGNDGSTRNLAVLYSTPSWRYYSAFGASDYYGWLHLYKYTENAVYNSNPNCTVTYYTISATYGDNGLIEPAGAVVVEAGADTTFTFTPNNCFEIDTLWVNDVVTVPDSIVSKTGYYTFTHVNVDQTIHVTFKEMKIDTTKTAEAICAGDSLLFFSQYLKTADIYYHTLQSAITNCDSVIELTLTVNSLISKNIIEDACENTGYDFYGTMLYETGIYNKLLTSTENCDTLVTLDLTVHLIDTTKIPAAICAGDSLLFFSQYLKTADIYYHTLQSAITNCDSVIELTLTVNSLPLKNITEETCKNIGYNFYGTMLYETGIYNKRVTSATTCDTLVTLDLTVHLVDTTETSETICAGDSLLFFGQYLKLPATYYHALQSAITDCDSIMKLTLVVNPKATPSFAFGSALTCCLDSVPLSLPPVSTNGITGTWSPDTIETGTATVTPDIYTFTPTAGQCVSGAVALKVTVKDCPLSYVITATAGSGGTITPAGAVGVLPGDNQSFSFAPNTGYEVSQLIVDGASVPDSIAGRSYTFENVNNQHNILVTFKLIGATCPDQVFDVANGISYHVVELVGLCWTENLRNTKYSDGSDILFAQPYSHALYPNTEQNTTDFGLLYDWYNAARALNATPQDPVQGICPAGWRLPTTAELSSLNAYSVDDLRNTAFWLSPNTSTNTSGMDIRGAGYYNSAFDRFEDLLGYTAFWSSTAPATSATTATATAINYYCNKVEIVEVKLTDAISVRCVYIP